MVTTTNGWVKIHALVVWKLVILASISQQGQRHLILNSTKGKEMQMLNTPEERWKRHGKREMNLVHQMEGSLHLIDQVVTPHQTKKIRGMRDWYSSVIS